MFTKLTGSLCLGCNLQVLLHLTYVCQLKSTVSIEYSGGGEHAGHRASVSLKREISTTMATNHVFSSFSPYRYFIRARSNCLRRPFALWAVAF